MTVSVATMQYTGFWGEVSISGFGSDSPDILQNLGDNLHATEHWGPLNFAL